jgi:hypothetical protein
VKVPPSQSRSRVTNTVLFSFPPLSVAVTPCLLDRSSLRHASLLSSFSPHLPATPLRLTPSRFTSSPLTPHPSRLPPHGSRLECACQQKAISVICLKFCKWQFIVGAVRPVLRFYPSFILLPLSFRKGWQLSQTRRPRITSTITVVPEHKTRARLVFFFPLSALIIHPCLNAPEFQ